MSNEKRQTPTGYPTGSGYTTPTPGNGYGQYPYYYPQATPAAQPAYYPQNLQASPVQAQPSTSQVPGMLPLQESYIENIIRLNKGKLATIYMTFENNERWNAKVFKGIIEAAGRDHIIISDPETNRRYLLLMIYLDYVTFDEELTYEYPYGASAGAGPLSTYPPR